MSKSKEAIINEIAKNKMVEEFISNTAKTSNEDLRDLAQDIYLSIILLDEEKIRGMYERNELQFFISKMITNNIRSQTSPFYSKYKKWSNKRSDITEEIKVKNNGEKAEEYRWMKKKSVRNSLEN